MLHTIINRCPHDTCTAPEPLQFALPTRLRRRVWWLLLLQVADTTAQSDNMQQPSALQTGGLRSGASPWGANAHTVVSVTGAVLYTQGLWGLW